MLQLVVRRILWSVPLLFGVSALTFVLLALTPGDPTIAILGNEAPPEAYVRLRHELGLDDPIYVQYWHWLTGALHGDLGSSVVSSQPVTDMIQTRLPVTLSLILVAMTLSTALGLGLGVLAATRGGFSARVIDVVSLIGTAIPNYLLALGFVALFAVSWGLLPATGYVPFADSPGQWARSLVLPVLVLAIGGLALLAKQTRDSMFDVLSRDYITTLRAGGVSERSIIYKHALRNAAIPPVTVLGLKFAGMLSGTVIVESVFVLPGLGSMAVQGTLQHDVPVVQGVTLVFTLLVVAGNLLVDVSYGWLNPKARIA
ncbi:MAG: peptide/nickel transport system permease protein [Solirubrobacteraceae bacterium]